jgi:integrase
MTVLRLANVKRVTAKGRRYFYHRVTGKRLPDEPGSAAFIAAWTKEERAAANIAPPEVMTLGRLIERYRKSPEFTGLADKTRLDYGRIMDGLAPFHAFPVDDFTTPFVMQIRDKAALRGHRHANYVLAVMSRLFSWGRPRGFTTTNPVQAAEKVRRPKGTPKGNRAWTDAELAFVLAAAPPQIRMAVLIGLQGQCRQKDVIAMTRSAYDGELLEVRQSKTGKLTTVPVHPQLKAALDALPAGQFHLVTSARGGPFTLDGFKTSFFKLIRELEAEDCVPKGLTFHGLRHTAGKTLAEAGAGAPTIAAVLGCSLAVAEVYIRGASLKVLAREGARLRDAGENTRGTSSWKTDGKPTS